MCYFCCVQVRRRIENSEASAEPGSETLGSTLKPGETITTSEILEFSTVHDPTMETNSNCNIGKCDHANAIEQGTSDGRLVEQATQSAVRTP